MKYLYKLCGKISLLSYILMLYQLWHLCKYGGLRSHMPILISEAVFCGTMFLLWLIARQHFNKDASQIGGKSKLFCVEALTFVAATIFCLGGIVYSAIPYHGALSWKIEEIVQKREITLKHNNLFEDGIEGILSDLDKKLDLPEKLYISGEFQVTFDATGTVQKISALLCGKDSADTPKTYLVDYNADKGDRMTVWLDVYTNDNYEQDMQLEPMLCILKNAAWQQQVSDWSVIDENQQYEILYAGRRTFAVEDGLQYLPGDADGDGLDSGTNCIHELYFGGNVAGFEVSLHIPESENILPVRYIMEPVYIPLEELIEERTAQTVEQAKDSLSWTVDQNDSSMYFFLDDSHGWRLTVTDAAAGSRFYIMERTQNGGISWDIINENPFLDQAGVAEGLIFYDENLGVAGLSGASQTTSSLYLTKDGGITFKEICLPMDQVTELPADAKEYGFTIEDYNYLNMPEINENLLKITVVTEAMEKNGIVFCSNDEGETWSFEKVIK